MATFTLDDDGETTNQWQIPPAVQRSRDLQAVALRAAESPEQSSLGGVLPPDFDKQMRKIGGGKIKEQTFTLDEPSSKTFTLDDDEKPVKKNQKENYYQSYLKSGKATSDDPNDPMYDVPLTEKDKIAHGLGVGRELLRSSVAPIVGGLATVQDIFTAPFKGKMPESRMDVGENVFPPTPGLPGAEDARLTMEHALETAKEASDKSGSKWATALGADPEGKVAAAAGQIAGAGPEALLALLMGKGAMAGARGLKELPPVDTSKPSGIDWSKQASGDKVVKVERDIHDDGLGRRGYQEPLDLGDKDFLAQDPYPYIDPKRLSVDENGIPRDKGLSRDVQAEAYDKPHQGGDLFEGMPEREPVRNRTLEEEAMWQNREHEVSANERAKSSQMADMWRDYDAVDTVARIPALKERLENPLGRNQLNSYAFWHSTKNDKMPFFGFNPDKRLSGEGAMIKGAGDYASLSLKPQGRYLESFTKSNWKEVSQNLDQALKKRPELARDGADASLHAFLYDYAIERQYQPHELAMRRARAAAADHGGTLSPELLAFVDKFLPTQKFETRPLMAKGRYDAQPHEMIDGDKPIAEQPHIKRKIEKAVGKIIYDKINRLEKKLKTLEAEHTKKFYPTDAAGVRRLTERELEKTQPILEEFVQMINHSDTRIEDIQGVWKRFFPTDKHGKGLSALMKAEGIKGMVYDDAGSRYQKNRDPKRSTRNIVMFDPASAKLEKWYDMNEGKPIASGLSGSPKNYGTLKAESGLDKVKLSYVNRDSRNGYQFVEDFTKEGGKLDTDIASQIGAMTSSYRSSNPKINNQSWAYRIADFMNDALELAKEEIAVLNHKNKDAYYDLATRYNISNVKKFDRKGFQEDTAIALRAEKDPASWGHDLEKWYPNEGDLVNLGMKPESAKVWSKVYEALDDMWDTEVKSARMAGKDIPERIPGYLPHQFKGPYRVLVHMSDPETGLPVKNVAELNYTSRRAMERGRQQAEQDIQRQGATNLEVTVEEPTAQGRDSHALIEGVRQARDRMDGSGNKALGKLLEIIYQNAAEGIITTIMDRSNPTKIGHALERVNMTGEHGLSVSQMKDALQGIQKAHEAANEWFAKVKFANEVLFPMDKAGMLSLPKLRKTTDDWVHSFFGVEDKALKDIDTFLKDKIIKLGGDPHLLDLIAQGTNSTFSKIYLTFKPAFYILNRLQFTQGIPHLLTVRALQRAAGEPTGSITKAVAAAAIDFPHSLARHSNHWLSQYAEKHGITDPKYMENTDPGKWRDPISLEIERQSRMNTFAQAYHYFKQTMPKQEALNAAAKEANKISVPYDADVGAPTLLNKLPAVAKPIVMFMTYNQSQLGLFHESLRTVARAGKVGPKAMADALAGLLAIQATNVTLLGGLGGAVYLKNWDDAARAFNKALGSDLPTADVLARHFGGLSGSASVNKILNYGATSTLLGADLSNSGQGAALQGAFAGYDMTLALAGFALLGLKKATYGEVTKKEAWDAAQKLPPQIKGVLEHLIKAKNYADIAKKFTGEMKDYKPMPGDIEEKHSDRTLKEVWINSGGMNSLEQSDAATTEQITKMKDQSRAAEVSHKLQVLKEGNVSSKRRDQLVDDLLVQLYKTPEEVIGAIIRHETNKATTEELRKAKDASRSTEAAQKYLEWLKLQRTEPTRVGP